MRKYFESCEVPGVGKVLIHLSPTCEFGDTPKGMYMGISVVVPTDQMYSRAPQELRDKISDLNILMAPFPNNEPGWQEAYAKFDELTANDCEKAKEWIIDGIKRGVDMELKAWEEKGEFRSARREYCMEAEPSEAEAQE